MVIVVTGSGGGESGRRHNVILTILLFASALGNEIIEREDFSFIGNRKLLNFLENASIGFFKIIGRSLN